MKKSLIKLAVVGLLGFAVSHAYADVASAQKMADKYAGIAKTVDKGYAGLDAEAGKAFFNREIGIKGRTTSCATCHTTNPADSGKNVVTNKPIRPLSPVVNAKRFTDLDKVEEKFEEHCKDITGSDCAASDKANFIAYLLTAKEPSKAK